MTREASGGAGRSGERPPGQPEGPSGAGPRQPAVELPIGRYLASQRRLRGISLDELSARTRIPRRNLERLESGAFDAQPDGFVRGFVRTVAEALGLDPHEAVMRLVQEPRAADEEGVRRRRRWALMAASALLVVVLALGVAAVRLAVRWLTAPDPDPSPTWVYRRDAVRSLAEERADAGVSEPVGPQAEAPPAERAAPAGRAEAPGPPGPAPGAPSP